MRVLRRFLFSVFAIGVLGTGVELLLLGHTEDRWQLVPLALLALGLVALVALVWLPRSVTWFRWLMALFVVSGLAGIYLHYTANAEFEIEMYPSIGGFELVREALTGALPALAPAMMLHLGLLGLASTYRYPEGDSE